MHPNDDRRQKIIEVIDHPRKMQADQRWADQEEEEHEYIWQEGQWSAWLEEKPKEKGSALEELGIDAGGDPEKASVVPKRQA
jgi:hypothetical protein